jgi:CheY-like chemotaxis protein
VNAINRVMAVDDNPTNLAVIEETLQDRFHLRLVDNGKEALKNAATFLPDVVLLDVMMPRPDGYEVCSAMRNDPLLRYSSIIMVSASTAIEARLRAYRAGANDYVCKPFDEEELLAKVLAAVNVKSDYQTLLADVESFYSATGEVLELLTHLRDSETGEHIDRV